jgi:protein MpaA
MDTRAGRLLVAVLVAVTAVVGLQPANPASAAASARTPVLGKRIIGYSVQHRAIIAYHLGDPTKKPVLLIGQMHGDEHAGVIVANSIIHGSVSIEGINLWVIATMNPDGDAAHTRQNAHHVDLNRNWPYRWRHLTGQYYSGTRPLSEPESRAVHTFLLRVKPRYIVSLHQPLDGVDTTSGSARDRAFARTLARDLHLPSTQLRCWSTCFGSMTDWYTARTSGIGETAEFGWHPSHAYLVGTARRGIVAALHGTFGKLVWHNPRNRVTVTGGVGKAAFAGWAYDIDNRHAHLTYKIYEAGRLLATHRASGPRVSGHSFAVTLAATPGRHRYCTYVLNVGAGTGNPRTCAFVSVAKPAS